MCGIVGLFAKSPEIEERLGEHLAAMLVQMSSRGPDSAGVAVYRDPAPSRLEQADALLGRSARALGSGAGRPRATRSPCAPSRRCARVTPSSSSTPTPPTPSAGCGRTDPTSA